jgi:hypothetical protein
VNTGNLKPGKYKLLQKSNSEFFGYFILTSENANIYKQYTLSAFPTVPVCGQQEEYNVL